MSTRAIRILLSMGLVVLVYPLGAPASEKPEELSEWCGDYFGQSPPGTVPELYAPDILSTGHHEHSGPIYSPDMRHLVFTIADTSQHVILYKSRSGDCWSQTTVAPFSGFYSDDRPFFSPDGLRLYFESNRPTDGEFDRQGWNWWYSELSDSGWGEARLDDALSALDMSTPTLAANGNLYFVADRPEGLGRTDIYLARRKDGGYEEPVNLGGRVNSDAMEAYLHIASDESYLLFSSFGRDTTAGLYVSFKTPEGVWGEAVAFDETLNAEGDERFAIVSPDGRYLFFNSQRDGSSPYSTTRLTVDNLRSRLLSPQNSSSRGDIYWVDAQILDRLRPD